MKITIELDDLTEEEVAFIKQGRLRYLIADAMSDFDNARRGDYVERRYGDADWMSDTKKKDKEKEVELRRGLAEKLRQAGLVAKVEHPVAPRFTHDCDQCVFLGHVEDHGRTHDAYYCSGGKRDDPTLLARYGDDGPRYWSGPISVLEYNNRFEDPEYIGTKVMHLFEAHMQKEEK